MLFLIYTLAQCTMGIAVLIMRMFKCNQQMYRCFDGLEGRLTISLVILGLLALIFVTSML